MWRGRSWRNGSPSAHWRNGADDKGSAANCSGERRSRSRIAEAAKWQMTGSAAERRARTTTAEARHQGCQLGRREPPCKSTKSERVSAARRHAQGAGGSSAAQAGRRRSGRREITREIDPEDSWRASWWHGCAFRRRTAVSPRYWRARPGRRRASPVPRSRGRSPAPRR